MRLFVTLIFILSTMISCKSKITASFNDKIQSPLLGPESAGETNAPVVTSVKLEDDELIIEGSYLRDPTEVKINSDILSVVSSTASRIVLSSARKVSFAIGTALNLSVTTASGSSTVSVQFNLVDGSVTTAKIADGSITSDKLNLTAGNGQFLQYSGGTWQGADLSGLTYQGAVDMSGGTPNPDVTIGESTNQYYIVSVAGSANLDGITSWSIGDWAIFNGTSWQKIDNSTGVKTVNGSSGNVTIDWNDVITGSRLADIADVDTSGIAVGSVLKWNGSNWEIGTDNTVAPGSVTASSLDASLTASINSIANKVDDTTTVNGVALSSNITLDTDDIAEGVNQYHTTARARAAAVVNSSAGSETDQAASVSAMKSYVAAQTGGYGDFQSTGSVAMTGDLDMGGNAITNVGNVDGVDVSALNTTVAGKVDQTTTVNGVALSSNIILDTDDIGEGVTNLYYTTARAQGDVVVNSTAGTETTQAASVSAMKSYVASQISGGTGDFLADGSVPMTGDFDGGNQKITNVEGVDISGGLSVSLTGSVSVTDGTNIVTGVGTSFDTELSEGDAIRIEGETFTVTSITSATSLTLDSNHLAGASGVSATKDDTYFAVESGDGGSRFTILSDGRVGIGLSNPGAKLEVRGGDLLIRNNSENAKLRLRTDSASHDSLLVFRPQSGSSANFNIGVDGSDGEKFKLTRGNAGLGFNNGVSGDAVLTVDSSNNVGILNTSPSTALDVTGTVTATAFVGDGSGLTNLPSGGSPTDVTSVNFAQGANRAIDVDRATTGSGNNLTVSSGGAQSGSTDQNGGDLILSSGVSTGSGSSKIEFQTNPAGSSGTTDTTPTTAMTILGNGNVGIGTESPYSWTKLQVLSSNTTSVFSRNTDNDNLSTVLRLERLKSSVASPVAGFGARLDFALENEVNDSFSLTSRISSEWINSPTGAADRNSKLTFSVLDANSQLNAMTILNNGNVGIGTSSPEYELDLLGSRSRLRIGDSGSGGNFSGGSLLLTQDKGSVTYGNERLGAIEFYGQNNVGASTLGATITAESEAGWGAGSYAKASVNFYTKSGTTNRKVMKINHNNNVGIGGDDSPDAHLEVSAGGSSGGNALLISSDDDSDGDLLTVTEAGNIGVGTTNPSTKLELNLNDATSEDSTATLLKLVRESSLSAGDDGIGGTIEFFNETYSEGVTAKSAWFSGYLENADNSAPEGGMSFFVADGTGAEPTEPVLRIRDTGLNINGKSFSLADSTTLMRMRITNGYTSPASTSGTIDMGFGLGTSFESVKFKIGKEDDYTTAAKSDSYLAISTEEDKVLSEKMRIDSKGNVGIGTTNPSSKLEVRGGSIRTSGGYYSESGFYHGSEMNDSIKIDGADDSIRFTNNDNETVTILNNGNVGIGTTTPSSQLEVSGTVTATAFSGDGSALTGISASSTSDATNINFAQGANRSIDVDRATSGAGNNLSISSGGAQSGSTNENGGNLILSSGVSTGSGSSSIQFQTNPAGTSGSADTTPTTAMTILGNGNVGIGTTNPAGKLSVGTNVTQVVNDKSVGIDHIGRFHINGSATDVAGISSTVTSQTGSINLPHLASVRGIHKCVPSVTSDCTKNYGGYFELSNDSTNATRTVASGAALHALANHTSTSVATTKFSAGEFKVRVSSGGTVTKANGVLVNRPFNSGTLTNFNGVAVESLTSIGTVTDVNAFNYEHPTNPFVVKADGKVGIGTTTPSSQLTINADSGGATFNDAIRIESPFDYGQNQGSSILMNAIGTNGVRLLTSIQNASIGNEYTDFKLQNYRSGSWEDRFIVNGDGNVGIGTNSPTRKLHVSNDGNTAVRLDINSSNGGLGNANVTLGNNDTTIGNTSGIMAVNSAGAAVSFIDFININQNATGTQSGAIKFTTYGSGTNNNTLYLSESGNVGIGMTAPDDALDVVGDIDTTGCFQTGNSTNVGGSCVSDKRLKKNIKSVRKSLERILSLRPVQYVWRPEFIDIHGRKGSELGLIAQEVEEVFPELVATKDDGYKRVKYDVSFTLHIINAIKEFFGIYETDKREQDRQIASLKEENAQIKSENAQMKKFLCKKYPDAPFCN